MRSLVRIPLSDSGVLSAYGYEDVREKSELARHRALMILFKNKDPKLSKIFKKDRDWVREKLL